MTQPAKSERDRWSKGLVRHLRFDPSLGPHEGRAVRDEHDGGLKAGGSQDIYYTLVVHPDREHEVEELRRRVEGDPNIGGLFSPERDL